MGVLLAAGMAGAGDPPPLEVEARITAPLDSVWAAWSTGEGLRSWMAPHADIDLRVGGLMRANYQADGELGDGNTIENRVLSYEPGRMLSIQVARAPEGFPFAQAVQRMWTVIQLSPEDAGHTRVRVVSLGFGSDEQSLRMREFFEGGNAYTLELLRKRFEPPKP